MDDEQTVLNAMFPGPEKMPMVNFKLYMKNTTRFTKLVSKVGFTKSNTLPFFGCHRYYG